MERQKKHTLVSELHQEFTGVRNAVLVDFRGLKVSQIDDLRRKIRQSNSRYRVIKNTLARRALEKTPLESLCSHLEGVTGMAWNANDPVSLAKALVDFQKSHDAFKLKAGVVEGSAVAVTAIKGIAAIPGRAELLSRLLFLLKSPGQRVASILNAPVRNTALVLGQVARKKAEAGG